jgi:5-oxoprolinase (ATP-hydrolysing)
MKGFKQGAETHTRIEFMQSDGGLVSYSKFSGLRAILSGPAGGVVGFSRTSYEKDDGVPVIGFDMVRFHATKLSMFMAVYLLTWMLGWHFY